MTYQKKTVLLFLNSAKAMILGIIFISASFSVGATDYYVSLTGNNGYLGTSPGQSWRTITYAATRAQAGDIVYIKGGNYGDENVVVSNAGTSSNPIVFEGYDGIPVLDGADYTGNAIKVYGKPYITLRNIRVAKYYSGIWIDGNSHHALIDGCIADSCCHTDYVNHGWDGYGIVIQNSNYSVLQNSSTMDNGGSSVFMSKTNYCTVKNCQIRCKQTASNQYITDYFLVLTCCSYNTIRDCYVEDINGSYKGNHGIIIKDGSTPHSTGNLIVNCTTKNFEEGYVIAHEAYNNKVDSCYADNTNKNSSFNFCFQVREGAYDNTFSNCRGVGKTGLVSVYDGVEGSNPQTMNNNLFINCRFEGTQSTTIGAFLRNATNTTFKNCTFVNTPNLFRFSYSSTGSDANSGTVLKNCILSGVTSQYDTRSLGTPFKFQTSGTETGYSDMNNVSATYTDFWSGFSKLSGTGNISVDPLFANIDNSDFHLKSQNGRWDGTAWVNDELTSPCIDAGDPADSYANETYFNGNRINIGAYGNTAEASRSSSTIDVEKIENDWLTYYKKGQNLIIHLSPLDVISKQVFISLTTIDGRTTKQRYKDVDPIVIDISRYQKGLLIWTISTDKNTKSFKILND